ncbi:MAG: Asp-tRNA(Asn)/Glu-tRNA(Gln) amidotransferase subunit GatB [Nitrospirae bacterium]|nr:Asp-tRNA(Asn)/Glu-tRNA(Gln) amidotransferase subunit GatB [Nitrospirota bacterium]MBF0533740.1 Asp-tRNA(Asn)/Glu-tRNA(Gln) amidotransferase subunit GatB [Nitrospirota bacterium]MBF0615551.1 Asp-tRNA(Asn)/Glu-tRNA(Gln) amidotransferase subunit GatB [Nitrospirota bacterium]
MKKYEAVIGLEIHAQMLTKTKMFCGCSTKFGSEPNSQTCPVCIGMPGVLPVINQKAVEFTVRAGLALGCKISSYNRFARKNYFYPDLPKGYQISQYELPICLGGAVVLNMENGQRTIELTRIHMEEDAGKNIHEGTGDYSNVDLNRAGVPLMEIVTEPQIRSPKESSAFMKKLRSVLRYLDVCDGNMEEGSLRCDANVSLRPVGSSELGVKAEIKNINSFRFVEKAIEYEIWRQEEVLKDGGRVIQETRLYNTSTGTTESMRSKEEAHDYRYFPEPDLVPIVVSDAMLKEIKATIVELPDEKVTRYVNSFGLPLYDAELLSQDKDTAHWFEEAVNKGGNPKAVSNWIMGELMRLLNETATRIEYCKLTPEHLIGLIKLVDSGAINVKIGKTVFEEMFKSGEQAEKIVKSKGLLQISNEGELDSVIDAILNRYSAEVERFKAGEVKLTGFFVGEVMKQTKGKANPKLVNEILKKKLG